MIRPTRDPLLMGCSIDALRRKLTDPASSLAAKWQHFLTLARSDPKWYSPFTVLAALVTESEQDRQLARQSFLRFVESKAEGEMSNEAQYHTHVVAAPLGRWAIYYDWVCDAGLFTPAEDRMIREALLDFAFVFPLQQAQSRMRSFDNQVMANAFGAAAVGYVLGIRRGDNALGRRLFATGSNWLIDLLARLPAGGYAPEGSAYHEQVVLPMTLMSALLIEESTGLDVVRQGAPPTYTPLMELLVTSMRMIGPAGVLPAWDAYGYQAATIRCGLTYLARATGDRRPLQIMEHCRMWHRNAHPAWEHDDRLWSLIWWPTEQALSAPREGRDAFESYLIPEVAGALQDTPRQLRLFQYWDECGGVPTSGRCQVDPNAITLEAFGSPILLDGHGRPDESILPLPTDKTQAYVGQRTLETVGEYLHSAWGAQVSIEQAVRVALDGSVGMANSLVIDGESWYVPMGPRRGKGLGLHQAGRLQVLQSEAAEFYRDRYDVESVVRTSTLIDGRCLLVSDRVRAGSEHQVTWQAYLRQEAEQVNGRVQVRTAEQVQCDLIPLQPGQTTLREVAKYPRCSEGASVLMQHALPAGRDVRIDIALLPQVRAKVTQDITGGWRRQIGSGAADEVSLADAYMTDSGSAPDERRVFTRSITLTPAAGRCYFLRVETATPGLQVKVNGQAVAATVDHGRGIWEKSSAYFPWVYDITAALSSSGQQQVQLEAAYFHGETLCGPVVVCESCEVQATQVVRESEDSFVVQMGQKKDRVVVARTGAAAWAGGSTDAQHALWASDESVSVVRATNLDLPSGLQLRSQAPITLVWSPATATLQLVDWVPATQLQLSWPGVQLRVELGALVTAVYAGQQSFKLLLADKPLAGVVINGQLHEPGAAYVLPAQQPAALDAKLDCPEAVFEVLEQGHPGTEALILAGLGHEDWRVQVAAADAAGRLRLSSAVPVLLKLFEQGESEIPYPPLKMWWSFSKMLRNPNVQEGVDPNLPLPLGIKRWRVRRAAVTALGLIGDRSVAPTLEKALLKCHDFFPVTSQLALALGRLGSPGSLAILQRHLNHAEANTRAHARLSAALLAGEIDAVKFESQSGLA